MTRAQNIFAACSALGGLATFVLVVLNFLPEKGSKTARLEELRSELENVALDSMSWGDDRDGLLHVDTLLGRIMRQADPQGVIEIDYESLRLEFCAGLEGAVCQSFSVPQYASELLHDYTNIVRFCFVDVPSERTLICAD